MEVVDTDGSISRDQHVVLNKWKTDFSSLLNPQLSNRPDDRLNRNANITSYCEGVMNDEISVQEVAESMKSLKNNKAYGVDELPVEVVKNGNLINLLVCLFNKYFESGITTEIWKRGIIQPIPKIINDGSAGPIELSGHNTYSSCL